MAGRGQSSQAEGIGKNTPGYLTGDSREEQAGGGRSERDTRLNVWVRKAGVSEATGRQMRIRRKQFSNVRSHI